MALDTATRAAARPLLDRLEELIIEASLGGPGPVGERLAGLFVSLQILFEPFPESASAAAVSAATASLLRGIVAGNATPPRGFTEQLLETHSALLELAGGGNPATQLEQLLASFAPAAPRQPPALPPEVGLLFVSEAEDCLDRIERQVLLLETPPVPPEVVKNLARDLHNLKGSAGMSGHDAIVEIAHSLETQVLHGADDPEALIGAVLGGVDRVRGLVSQLREVELDRTARPENSPEAANYLLFEVGGQPMLIPLSDLVRVERPASVVPVPFTPPFVLGLTQLGGETMPLLELAPRLEIPADGTFPAWALVVGPIGERIALGVGKVAEIRSIWHGQLSPIPGAREETPDAAVFEDARQIPVLHVQKILNRPIQEDFVVLPNES